MAENKNALVNETAIENGNAALTERLEDAAERMAEAEKAVAQVAEEQKQRLAEQEQSSEQLQKEEEQRREQAQQAAKSVASRAAAVLDYTENYRQNQKLEKAARATVSKAKMERLAAEAEAKVKAEREAEEALLRDREELMARRQRSSALLKKVENDAQGEAPASQTPAEAVAPAKPVPAVQEERKPAPAMQEVLAEESAPDVLNIFADEELPAEQPSIAEDDGVSVVFAEDADETAAPEAAAEQTCESAPVAEESEKPLTAAQIVENDLARVMAEEKEKREKAAEIEKLVDEALLRVRLSQMMPEHMIPESLRLPKEEEKAVAEVEAEAEKQPDLAELIARLENAVAAADRTGEQRIADVLSRLEEMARRVEESIKQRPAASEAGEKAETGEKTEVEIAAVAVDAASEEPASAEPLADATAEDALPEAFGKEPFKRRELRRYLKSTKAEIAEKKKEDKKLKREKGESKKDYLRRRLESQAALLGTQFAAIALLSYKGHAAEAESFKKDAEAGIRRYNKDIVTYNRISKESCETLPEDLVTQIAKEGRLPENLPFGSAATRLDAAVSAGGDAGEDAPRAPEQQNEDLAKLRRADLEKQGAELLRQEKADREEQKKLRLEMQKEMLMHALLWNPAAAAVIKSKSRKKTEDEKDAAQTDAEAFRAAANNEQMRARREQRLARRAERNARREQELMDGYAAALSGKRKSKQAPHSSVSSSMPDTACGAKGTSRPAAASYDSLLSDEVGRKAYYRSRLSMIGAKRDEQKLLLKKTRSLPKQARHEVAAAETLDLIGDEINLLCLLHRYPDEKTAAICQKDCEKDIEQYNRHVAKLNRKKVQCKPISTLLPVQALRSGADMPADVWQQMDGLSRKGESYKPSKEELRASYLRAIAEDEKDREAIAAAAVGLTVAALRKENAASLKARAKVRAAIEEAEKEYESATAESKSLLAQCSMLAARKKPNQKEIAALTKRIEALDARASAAVEKKERLELAKTAAETSTTLSPKKKAQLLTLALSVSEKGARNIDGKTLESITAAVAQDEAKAAKEAKKKSRKKQKCWEKSIAATEAEALAAEDAADVAGERAARLYDEKGSSRMASEAYEQALMQDAKAHGARKVADTVRARREADEQSEKAHKDAKLAMAAMALSVHDARVGKRPDASKKKSNIDSAIADAERDCDIASQAYATALENSKNLEANGASAAERDAARRQCAALKAKLLAAEDKRDALRAAKTTAENSSTASKKEKSHLIALAVAASIQGNERSISRLKKRVDAVQSREVKAQARAEKKALRIREKLDKQFAAAEAQALVLEGNAQAAREKAEVLREKKSDKKTLNKAYKNALVEQARAEKARKSAEEAFEARSAKEAKESEREKKATLASAAAVGIIATRAGRKKAKAERKAAKRQARAEQSTAEQLEAYARACETRAAESEKQALLLAVEKGRQKKKLKAYETALTEHFEATKAREAANAVAEKQTDALARSAEESAYRKQRNAEFRTAHAGERTRLKQSAKEKRLAKKEEKAKRRLQKQQSKDARVWQIYSQRNDAMERESSYLFALEQEKKDRARIARQNAAITATKLAAEATVAKEALEAEKAIKQAPEKKVEQKPEKVVEQKSKKPVRDSLEKRALKHKQKEFEKRDIKMTEARYDAAIAEEKRMLEIRLCDLSVTGGMRRAIKRESAKQLRRLNKRKRLALRAERADNKRYFACLGTALVPKNPRTGTAELAQLRELLLALLAQRDEQNARLLEIYLGEHGKAARVKTPWHKAYIREKKRWQKKSRKTVKKIEELNLTRKEKQKLRQSVDRLATAHADIAEAKCRARKLRLKGVQLRLHKRELLEMRQELCRAEKNLKRKMKAAKAEDDFRSFVCTSIVSTLVFTVLVLACMIGWKYFGDTIWTFLETNFPTVTAQLK